MYSKTLGWDNYSNLISFSHFRGFLKKSQFCSINGHPKQYILVDTIFNYIFHFGLPGTCLYLSPQNTPFGRRKTVCLPDLFKDIFLEVKNKTCS